MALEQSASVLTSSVANCAQYHRIARQLLIEAQPIQRPIHQRVEPEQAEPDHRDGANQKVFALEMRLLVRQHQRALARAVAHVEVGWNNDARS